jgi:hypothetical protein
MNHEPRTNPAAIILVTIALGVVAVWASRPSSAQTRGPLAGAVDIHVHTAPDNVERAIDAIEMAGLARDRGMRAIVLKSHYESTAALAYVVRKVVPGIEVFGGIDLNLTVGGINPAAVAHMAQVTGGWGRVVWMSTFDSEHQVTRSKQSRPFVRVSRGGELLPEVREVIALIAKHNLVMATGHASPAESLAMIREARRLGVRRMVVTHAMVSLIGMTVAQMREAAAEGAYIEFVYNALVGAKPALTIDQYVAAIRQVGPQSCILSSDLGQPGNPLPPDGLAAFVQAMLERGVTQADVDRMVKENPARLLGLP